MFKTDPLKHVNKYNNIKVSEKSNYKKQVTDLRRT